MLVFFQNLGFAFFDGGKIFADNLPLEKNDEKVVFISKHVTEVLTYLFQQNTPLLKKYYFSIVRELSDMIFLDIKFYRYGRK